MKYISVVFCLVTLFSTCVPVCAATRAWTGQGGNNEWTNVLNWSANTLPSNADTVLFTNDVPLSVRVHGQHPYGKIWRFEGRDVVFGSDEGRRQSLYISSTPTCEVYVVAGTTVTTSNSIYMYNSAPLLKTGGGVLRTAGSSSATTYLNHLLLLDIKEGEVQTISSGDYGSYLTNIDDIYIRSGAKLRHRGYNATTADTVIHIEEGASAHFDFCSSQSRISSVLGEGDLEISSGTLELTFYRGPVEFSGTVHGNGTLKFVSDSEIADENKRFIVGSGDALAAANVADDAGALAFAAGVGSFSVGKLATAVGGALHLEDEDGEPVSLNVKLTDASRPNVTGSGNLHLVGSASTFTNGQLQLTGTLSADKSSSLDIGNGTVEGDADVSTLESLNSEGSLTIKNDTPLLFDKPLTGCGRFYNYTDLVLTDFAMTNVELHVISNLVLAGGRADIKNWRCWNEDAVLTVSGGMFCNGKSVGGFREGTSVLKTPYFITVATDHPGTYRFTGGEAWLENRYGQISRLELLGGLCVVDTGYSAVSGRTAENPTTVFLNGGTLGFSSRIVQYWFQFPSATEAFEVQLGEKGGRIRGFDLPSSYCSDSCELRLNTKFVTASGCETDGGIVFDLRRTGHTLRPYRPFLISGPFTLRDGRVAIDYYSDTWHPDLIAYPSFFGSGDFTLDSGVIVYADTSKTATIPENAVLRLASGAGSKVVVGGSSAIRFRSETSKPARHVLIGADNAENPALVRVRGGALFLNDANVLPSAAGGSSLKVNGGSAVHTEGGLSKLPVFYEYYTEGHIETCFTTYDGDIGFCAFEGSVSSFEGCEGKVVEAESENENENSVVIAAGTEASALAVRVTDWATLTLKEGSRLNVGNGIDPACLLLDYQAHVTGSGTIDFGSSEGVIVVGTYYEDEGHALYCGIDGENGVSYVANPDFATRLVRASGENKYSGPTYISAAAVAARNARTFSTGKVYVTGGYRNGGKVIFDRPLEIDNDFRVSGSGHRLKASWGSRLGGWGALSFLTNSVTLSGSIEIDDMAMTSAQNAQSEGVFTGVVSGGRLQVYPGEGRVVLAASNTYTGGTEIVQSTLVLAGASPSVGTGAVAFDDGVLRFENTAPLVFTNDIEGVGSIELAGAPVTFASSCFSSLPVTNLAAGTMIDVSAMDGSVIVAAVDAGGLDLGGRDLTVSGISGSGRVSGGVLTVTGEINPGGAGAIGKLTFEKAPVLAGAVYVCDLIGEAADEISVEDDFALTGLSFSAVQGAERFTGHRSDVVTCEGSLSGIFSATAFPRGLYSIEYGETKARLNKVNPLKIIVR